MKAFTNLSPAEWKNGIDDDNAIVLDVRTNAEFSDSFIPGAKNLDVGDADFKSKVIQFDKSKPCYVYCRSGIRSAKAMGMMQEIGFTEVYNLEGGILAWEYKGFEVDYGEDF